MVINLVIMPGQGLVTTEYPEGTTVQDILDDRSDLSGRSVVVNGRAVANDRYRSTVLTDRAEVGLLGNSKGA